MKKSKTRGSSGKDYDGLINIESKSVINNQSSKHKQQAFEQSNSIIKRGVKRVVRNKSSINTTKMKKNSCKKISKPLQSKKKLIKAEMKSESDDSQADKENDTPAMSCKMKRGRKKGSFNKTTLENTKIKSTVLESHYITPDTRFNKKNKKKSPEIVEEPEKVLKDVGESL